MANQSAYESGTSLVRAWRGRSLCVLSVVAVAALLPFTSAGAAETVACGNRVYDKEAIFSFQLDAPACGRRDRQRSAHGISLQRGM
jgi:hypothetical protein